MGSLSYYLGDYIGVFITRGSYYFGVYIGVLIIRGSYYLWDYIGVLIIRGSYYFGGLYWGPYPTIWGIISGSLFFVNPPNPSLHPEKHETASSRALPGPCVIKAI